jgi:hypothetical protein
VSGWFAMKRGVHEHPLFHKQPQRLYVWTWIVATAAWKDTRQDANGKTVIVKRGQILTSYRQISDATGVGVQVIRTLLDRLRDERAIDTDANTGRLLITIRNYEKYQDARGDGNTGQNTRATHEQHTKGTSEPVTLEADASNDAAASAPIEVSVISSAVWTTGKQYLASRGIANAGAMIGRWLKDHPPLALLAAIEAAQRSGTQDPIPYITETLKGGPAHGQRPSKSTDKLRAFIAGAD